ncbi:MAG: cyclodeaminase/cyclohydrolase family protein [Chloroflexi bacterium]|nr:cyclodeaminase/cyclohydrolase family protein [Chloroflexota bacterium]
MQLAEVQKLGEFLAALASPAPTPGGGAAAAVAGAHGAALLSMVCHFSLGRENLAAWQDQIQDTLVYADAARARFLSIVDADAAAYVQVSQAYAQPHRNREERLQRRRAIADALYQATQPPLTIIEITAELVLKARALVEHSNRNLVSDLGAAGIFLETAYSIARANIAENVHGLGDDPRSQKVVDRWLRTSASVEDTLLALRASVIALLPSLPTAPSGHR